MQWATRKRKFICVYYGRMIVDTFDGVLDHTLENLIRYLYLLPQNLYVYWYLNIFNSHVLALVPVLEKVLATALLRSARQARK